MTSSRVIRGTKAKIFLYLCAILVIVVLVSCYKGTLMELDEISKSNDICHQQQENLSTQLQVISDYKLKLEKSLKNEKAEHQQSKNTLEIKINEEKSRNQKISNDALIKYKSLQQHYNLLKTQHDDFEQTSGKVQKTQLEEINSLQAKLKEVEEELKKVKVSKENVKTHNVELEQENAELRKTIQTLNENDSQQTIKFYTDQYRELREKYNDLQTTCGVQEPENNNKVSEKAVLHLPGLKLAENPSSSTKSSVAVIKSSSSTVLLPNGARPLLVPSITPETVKKKANLKPPQGVVEPPENRENQNEEPQLHKDDPERDNVAQEVFDSPNNNNNNVNNNNIDGLGFAEDTFKAAAVMAPNNKKRYEEYKDLQREEEDDDIDDYADHQARAEDVAVRN